MGASDAMRLMLPSRPSALAAARRFVDQHAVQAGFSPLARDEISLAVTEAVSNAVRYGSPAGEADTVEVSVMQEGSRITITVRDHGRPFSPPTPSLPDPAAFAEHGRGLFLMQQLMDEVRFSRDDGTVVSMTKIRQPGTRAAGDGGTSPPAAPQGAAPRPIGDP
jgi:serine/threonine-protein kinase RsbW